AFPLVGSLVDAGASIIPGVAFLTTLTMVGAVTFPLEKQEFGTKFALTRNLLSFSFALLIAVLMGVIL
ncbi:MAG: permease, partial [Clostridia bacterium]|nr:permease [Clostridia bacterium]